jgi:hypothetical protein
VYREEVSGLPPSAKVGTLHGTAGKMIEEIFEEELFKERNDSRFLSTLNVDMSEGCSKAVDPPSDHDEYRSIG